MSALRMTAWGVINPLALPEYKSLLEDIKAELAANGFQFERHIQHNESRWHLFNLDRGDEVICRWAHLRWVCASAVERIDGVTIGFAWLAP